jgi:hypothetical protein
LISAYRSTPQLRARLKRVFIGYYLELCSDSIATPGEVYEAIRDYFETRALELEAELFRSQMDEELYLLAGEIEQDLRQRHPGTAARCLEAEPLEARLRECVAAAWVDFGAQPGKLGRGSAHQ